MLCGGLRTNFVDDSFCCLGDSLRSDDFQDDPGVIPDPALLMVDGKLACSWAQPHYQTVWSKQHAK